MKNLLISYQFTAEQYLLALQNLSTEKPDRTEIEKNISENLDDFILNSGERLLESPIQSLYNIFNHEKRNLTQHNLCYDLIKQNYEQKHDPNIFVLLKSIDGSKLSRENLIDSINKRNERLGMVPNYESSLILQKEQEINALKVKNDQLESRINEMAQMIRDMRFNIKEEHETTYFQYRFFVPLGQEWSEISPTKFTLNFEDETFEVISSSTWTNHEDHTPQHLFSGKFEFENGKKWGSDQLNIHFIQINFSVPKCANVLSMTSRDYSAEQAPISFEVWATLCLLKL